jgi:glutaminyl-tRNA synthetase
LCTLEFIDARASYEWLCDALEVYKPRQYETARLQLTGTFLSKRKIKALVENGHVRGWDDPRLFTLIALRRRGIPPAAMLKFVEELGVSLSNSEIRLARFEQAIRQTLELMVPRLFVVLSPVKLIIENVEEDWTYAVEKPLHPKIPEMGKSKLTMTKTLIIDRDDFRITPPAEFSRLSPGKSVMLMGGPHPVTCTGYETDASGDVTEIRCALENGTGPNGDRKFKAKDTVAIHWLSNAPEGKIELDEVRFFEPLFKSENPAKLENYEDDINPDSLKVYKGAYIEPTFFGLAKNLIKQAKEEADKRTKAAASFSAAGNVDAKAQSSVEMGTNSTATDVPHGSDPDTPVATAAQLVGMECIRFQGMRLAYFAVDKESVLGCLNEGDGVEAGQRSGDKLILNKIVSLKEEKGKAA